MMDELAEVENTYIDRIVYHTERERKWRVYRKNSYVPDGDWQLMRPEKYCEIMNRSGGQEQGN